MAKKLQVIALGQLDWTLRRIQAATGVRRETAGAYLKAAGLAVRPSAPDLQGQAVQREVLRHQGPGQPVATPVQPRQAAGRLTQMISGAKRPQTM